MKDIGIAIGMLIVIPLITVAAIMIPLITVAAIKWLVEHTL